MSKLETAVKPALEPMILQASNSELSPELQRTLAAWAFKTAAMLQYVNSAVPPLPSAHLLHLCNYNEPPPSVAMWMAAFIGSSDKAVPVADSIFYDSTGYVTETPVITLPYRYAFTLRIDKVTFQFVGSEGNRPFITPGFDHGWWGRHIVTIWPSNGITVRWPPELTLALTQWQPFAERFMPVITRRL